MPYIGTTPTKVVSRQSANVYRYTATAGQSVFTGADLDNNVLACNPADMIVHMNGLRLESTDYTATSTSVTLTTAATAGDEVTVTSFVTFEVADTYTKTAADDRYVNTTGDTMTGTLDVDASVFGRSFEFRAGSNALTHGVAVHSTVANTLQFNTQSVERMRIDSAGRVTMPYQPAFRARAQSGDYTTLNQVLPFNQVDDNIGGYYNGSLYRFTAPVDGFYVFFVSVFSPPSTTSWQYFRVNGGNRMSLEAANSSSNYVNRSDTYLTYLSANDYVDVTHRSGTTHLNGNFAAPASYFGGYLIG